jgi:hypothetical protein
MGGRAAAVDPNHAFFCSPQDIKKNGYALLGGAIIMDLSEHPLPIQTEKRPPNELISHVSFYPSQRVALNFGLASNQGRARTHCDSRPATFLTTMPF